MLIFFKAKFTIGEIHTTGEMQSSERPDELFSVGLFDFSWDSQCAMNQIRDQKTLAHGRNSATA